MKIAKMEIKMILALMLLRYEYTLVDAAGLPTKHLPKLDRNDIHQVSFNRCHFFFCLIAFLDLLVRPGPSENHVSFSTKS